MVTTRYEDLAGESYQTAWNLKPTIYQNDRYVHSKGIKDLARSLELPGRWVASTREEVGFSGNRLSAGGDIRVFGFRSAPHPSPTPRGHDSWSGARPSPVPP